MDNDKLNKKMENNNQENNPSMAKNLANVARSKPIKITIIGILVLVILIGTFGVGVAVGYRKANFSFKWGENYHKNFGGPKGGFMRQLPPPFRMEDDFINANGTTGAIIKIDGNTLVVDGDKTPEKIIVVADKTIIRRGQQNLKLADLKVGDLTVTIGRPNASGQIEADLIRIFNSK